jgi:putative ABC transport system permease protein
LGLLPADAWTRVAQMPGVAQVAPVAVADSFTGYPIVATEPAFLVPIKVAEGRLFAGAHEAVVGADVRITLGATFRPLHGTAAENVLEQHEHDVTLTVSGRLARTGTPWDRAIIVSMRTIALLHASQSAASSPSTTAATPLAMPVPALVVKPATVADAYRLRRELRDQGWLAVFPAEILLPLYRLLGDVRDLFAWTAVAYMALVLAAIMLVVMAVLSARRQALGVLRALGAPPAFPFFVVWLQCVMLITAGVIAGAIAGVLVCHTLGAFAFDRTGLVVTAGLGAPELQLLVTLVVAASVLAAAPSLLTLRGAAVRLLRSA